MSAFPCTKCGICCTQAGLDPHFSEPTLPTSRQCVHLTRKRTCAVYSTRPPECRIAPADYNLNKLSCNWLQEHFKVPVKYRLPIVDNP